MSSIFIRHVTLLRGIPRYPRKITARQLLNLLEKEGFEVGIRTIQRDLRELSTLLPDLESDENKDIAGWCWRKNALVSDIPGIDPAMALTFKLSETFLREMIPPTILELIRPYFISADNIMKGLDQQGFRDWTNKVRMLPRTQPLIPAQIDPEVVLIVYDALFKGVMFRGRYRRRDGDEAEYDFHSLGLVFRNSVAYLVANVWDYQDPRHYALHRFKKCELIDEPSRIPKDFNLDNYLRTGSFEYVDPKSSMIKLEAVFRYGSAMHLYETPLSEDQVLISGGEGTVRLSATVRDSEQLKWWLLGFGDCVTVIKPTDLAKDFKQIAQAMLQNYG